MTQRSLISAAAAVALAGFVPAAALAIPPPPSTYGQPGPWSYGQNRNAQGGPCGYQPQRRHDDEDENEQGDGDRGDRGEHRGWSQGRGNPHRSSGYGYGYGDQNCAGGNYGYGQSGALRGVVSAFSPYNLDVQGGPHIRLHDGTVINPTGTNLTPGQRVVIYGHPNADGTFEADRIDVVGGGYGYGPSPYGYRR